MGPLLCIVYHPSQTNSILPPFTLLLNHSTISILLFTVRAPLSTSFRTIASTAQNNSAVARSRAMHCLSPTPNITLSLIISEDGSNHRSGSKFCGLRKTERFNSRECAETPTIEPGGIDFESTVSPADPTTRGRRVGLAKATRRPSLITEERYGRFWGSAVELSRSSRRRCSYLCDLWLAIAY